MELYTNPTRHFYKHHTYYTKQPSGTIKNVKIRMIYKYSACTRKDNGLHVHRQVRHVYACFAANFHLFSCCSRAERDMM